MDKIDDQYEQDNNDNGGSSGRDMPKSSSKLDDEMKRLIEKAAEGYAKRIHDEEKIGISDIISDVMSAIMKKEREFFLLQGNKYEEANGFYSRSLRLAIGKLDLKIPRIRIGNDSYDERLCVGMTKAYV